MFEVNKHTSNSSPVDLEALRPFFDAGERSENWERRALRHHLNEVVFMKEIVERRDRAKDWLSGSEPVEIAPGQAMATIDHTSNPTFEAAVGEACRIVESLKDRDDLPSKSSRDWMASTQEGLGLPDYPIGYSSPLTKLAFDRDFITPIVRYFAALPVLQRITVCRSRNAQEHPSSSQLFHCDPTGIKSMKVFIYLNDVDEQTGPFMALPASVSEDIRERYDYTGQRLSDEDAYAVADPAQLRVHTGPKGTSVYCDTARCFHCGARQGTKERFMLMYSYLVPQWTYDVIDRKSWVNTEHIDPSAATADECLLLGRDIIEKCEL